MTRRLLTVVVLTLTLALHVAVPAGAVPAGAAARGDRPVAGWTFTRWAEALLALIQGGSPLARAVGAAGLAIDPDGAPSNAMGPTGNGGQAIDPNAASADADAGLAIDPNGSR